MADSSTHLAKLANIRSIKYASEKNKDAWLALYHDDAILRDPVGISPLDPSGKGHHGKTAIAQFYDIIIANSNLTMIPGERIASGEFSCAVPMKAINDMGNGIKTEVNMIAVYEVDTAGLIISMNAYWDWSLLQNQLNHLS